MFVHGWRGADTILVSFIIFIAPSLNMHLAHSSGHYVEICANGRVVVFMTCTSLFQTIPFTIAATWYGITYGGFQFFF